MCELISAISAATVATKIALAVSAVSAVAGLAGTATSMIASNQQAKAQQAQANYQAQVAEQNKKIAQKEAAEERQQGLENARNERIKALSAIGAQKTAMAANGLEIAQGSALDTIEDTAMIGELNALNAQYNAEQRAINYEQQAYNFQNEANLRTFEGINARKAGKINMASAGLNGLSNAAGSVSSTWSGFGKDLKFSNTPKIKGLGTTMDRYAGIYNA